MIYKLVIIDTKYNEKWIGEYCDSYEEALQFLTYNLNADKDRGQLGRFTYTIVPAEDE